MPIEVYYESGLNPYLYPLINYLFGDTSNCRNVIFLYTVKILAQILNISKHRLKNDYQHYKETIFCSL